MNYPQTARVALGIFFIVAGTLHFMVPDFYTAIIPSSFPAPAALVALSGVAEIAGGVGLMMPRVRQAAGVGLVLLLIAVFPANLEMLRLARLRNGSGWLEAVLWLRLPLQVVLIWLVWRLSRPYSLPRGRDITAGS